MNLSLQSLHPLVFPDKPETADSLEELSALLLRLSTEAKVGFSAPRKPWLIHECSVLYNVNDDDLMGNAAFALLKPVAQQHKGR